MSQALNTLHVFTHLMHRMPLFSPLYSRGTEAERINYLPKVSQVQSELTAAVECRPAGCPPRGPTTVHAALACASYPAPCRNGRVSATRSSASHCQRPPSPSGKSLRTADLLRVSPRRNTSHYNISSLCTWIFKTEWMLILLCSVFFCCREVK